MSVITDSKRREFLDALDASDDIDVSDWEAKFLDSTLFDTSFTDAQRDAIDRMILRYRKRLEGGGG
jgi:hypothetical protein